MAGDVPAPRTYRLEQVVDPAAWSDVAVSRAVCMYPAIAAPAPSPTTLREVAALEDDPAARVVRLLRAAAAGVLPTAADDALASLEAVSVALASRLFYEHLLGETLFESLRDDACRYVTGDSLLAQGTLLVTREALIALAVKPLLVSAYEPAVTLFLLTHHGLHDVFAEVHCAAIAKTPRHGRGCRTASMRSRT